MTDTAQRIFRAYVSRKQAVVLLAAFVPMVVLFTWNLPLHPDLPMAGRVLAALVVLPTFALVVGPVQSLLATGPQLEVSPEGILWRNWSGQLIQWGSVDRWGVKRFFGFSYVTLWLKDPDAFRPATFGGWLQRSNRWLGFGDIAINPGGTNRSFEQLAEAFSAIAPKPPLPVEPKLARRLAQARARQERRR